MGYDYIADGDIYSPVSLIQSEDGESSSFGNNRTEGGKGGKSFDDYKLQAGNNDEYFYYWNSFYRRSTSNGNTETGGKGGRGYRYYQTGYDSMDDSTFLYSPATNGKGGWVKITYTKTSSTPQITLSSNYRTGLNYVPLSWTNTDTNSGWEYDVYRKQDGESRFTRVENTSEYAITATNTNDTTATDKAAPVINTANISKINGDNTKVQLDIDAEDKGTTYQHYVVGTNEESGIGVNNSAVNGV